MVKIIRTKTGLHTVNAEEMLMAYDKMIKAFANDCVRNLSNITGNIDSFDDYEQQGRIEALAAFKRYDVEQGTMFSTYLQQSLKFVFIHLLRDKNAAKRKIEKPLVYIDKETELGGEDGVSVLRNPKEDKYFEEEEVTLVDFLKERLTKEEMSFLAMGYSKRVGKATKIEKSSLEYAIDIFQEFSNMNVNVKTKAELASVTGMSRPTLNKRIKDAMEKTQKLTMMYLELVRKDKEIGA